jgi:hypothetical protein
VIEIPAEAKAARDAWDALPEAIRRDALRRASNGEAADDAAVAAIIAGVLRERPQTESWLRRAVWMLPPAVVFGFLVALQYFGLLAIDTAMTAIGLVFAAIAVLVVGGGKVADLVKRWMCREPQEDLTTEAIPKYAEWPNLRKVLDASPVRIPEPLVVRGHPRLRSFLLDTGLWALMALGFIGLLDKIQPDPGDYHRLLHTHVPLVDGAVVGLIVSWMPHLRNTWRLPLRIDEQGLRFGLRKAVPWPDVLSVRWSGPTTADPDTKPALFWRLRERPDVRIDLDAVQVPPEQIVLAAEAYKGRRGLLT